MRNANANVLSGCLALGGCVSESTKYIFQVDWVWLASRQTESKTRAAPHKSPLGWFFSALWLLSKMCPARFLLHWGRLMDRCLKVKSLMQKPKQKDYSSLWRGPDKIMQNRVTGTWRALSAGLRLTWAWTQRWSSSEWIRWWLLVWFSSRNSFDYDLETSLRRCRKDEWVLFKHQNLNDS